MIPSTISYVLTTTHFHNQIQSLLLIPYYDYSLYVCQGGVGRREKGTPKCSALGVHVVSETHGGGSSAPSFSPPPPSLPPAGQTLAPPASTSIVYHGGAC